MQNKKMVHFQKCVLKKIKALSFMLGSIAAQNSHAGIISFMAGQALSDSNTVTVQSEQTVVQKMDLSGRWSKIHPDWMEMTTAHGDRIPVRRDLVNSIVWDEDRIALNVEGKEIYYPTKTSHQKDIILGYWKQYWMERDGMNDSSIVVTDIYNNHYLIRKSMIMSIEKKARIFSENYKVGLGSGELTILLTDDKASGLFDQLKKSGRGYFFDVGNESFWINYQSMDSIDVKGKKGYTDPYAKAYYIEIKSGVYFWGGDFETLDQAMQRKNDILKKMNVISLISQETVGLVKNSTTFQSPLETKKIKP